MRVAFLEIKGWILDIWFGILVIEGMAYLRDFVNKGLGTLVINSSRAEVFIDMFFIKKTRPLYTYK